MMSFRKRFLAGSLAVAMILASLSGCSDVSSVKKSDLSKDYSEIPAAAYDGKNIYLDEVNYYLRSRQIMYEYYGSMYGQDLLASEDMVKSLREETLSAIKQTKVLCQHAGDYDVELNDEEKKTVSEAVEEMLSSDSNKNLIEITGADEELLTNIMTENALANKVYYTIISKTEIKTTEESTRENAISYILLKEKSEEETAAETTAADSTAESETQAETKTYTEKDANAALKKLQAGTSIDDLAKSLGEEAADTNFSVNADQDSDFGKTAIKLKKGESAVAYVEGTGWYVMYCDSENDKDASKTAYDNAVQEEKDAYFKKVYEEMDKSKFEVNQNVINSLDVANTSVLGSDETEAESASETAADETTEAAKAETETTAAETTAAQ